MSDRTSAERTDTERQSGAGNRNSRTAEDPGAGKANPPGQDDQPGKGAQPAKVRKQRTWVPGTAALVCLLIGLSDILGIFKPTWHDKLGRINAFVPGTLTNVNISAYAIVGLLLMLLSHGLRRR
jgi:lysyl-tRNA synthetase, class II